MPLITDHSFVRNPRKSAALCVICGRGQSVHETTSVHLDLASRNRTARETTRKAS